MEDLLPIGSGKLLNYPIFELLYFLTYYFLIKFFVVFSELMSINQLLYSELLTV